MPTRRCKCGRVFMAEKETHFKCGSCWLKSQRRLRLSAIEQAGEGYKRGYTKGYDDGFLAGEVAGSGRVLDREIVRRAIQLCHPDRQPGREELANEVTAALLSFLKTVEGDRSE